MFTLLEHSSVLLQKNGLFTQAEIATREGEVYARVGRGFARLRPGGSCSVARLFWSDLDVQSGTCVQKGYKVIYVPSVKAMAAE